MHSGNKILPHIHTYIFLIYPQRCSEFIFPPNITYRGGREPTTTLLLGKNAPRNLIKTNRAEQTKESIERDKVKVTRDSREF